MSCSAGRVHHAHVYERRFWQVVVGLSDRVCGAAAVVPFTPTDAHRNNSACVRVCRRAEVC